MVVFRIFNQKNKLSEEGKFKSKKTTRKEYNYVNHNWNHKYACVQEKGSRR